MRMTPGLTMFAAITMIAGTSATAAGDPEEADPGVVGEVTPLSGSVEPLREHFNAHKDKQRFIAILSPT